MKLQQLRYAIEVYRHNLNVSDAAQALFTSQPGVSKQIRLLEDELGLQIFIRNGKRIVSVSQPGLQVLQTAERILHDIQNIRKIGKEFAEQDDGFFTIAATHMQAAYVLPDILEDFIRLYPKVKLRIKQDSPSVIARMVADNEADIGLITDCVENNNQVRSLPCSRWTHCIVVPKNHELAQLSLSRRLTLADIVAYPLVCDELAFASNSHIARAFRLAGISEPQIALSASDTYILKTYVKLGFGIGLMAQVAFDESVDHDLTALPCHHLFEPSQGHLLLRSNTYLRSYIYQFIQLFSPELDKEKVDCILYTPTMEDFSI